MREGTTASVAEDYALTEVIQPVLQRASASTIHSNYRVDLDDGTTRFIDFAIITPTSRIAVEIDGYSYHAQGVISRGAFDDQLDRQNALVLNGWTVLRFSFDQLRSNAERCKDQLRRLVISDPLLHTNFAHGCLEPSQLQLEALAALQSTRVDGKERGLVALPTGTGKTLLSALDAQSVGGRILFIVHNNEILRQAANSYRRVFPSASIGFINSVNSSKAYDEDLIFANISSLRNPNVFREFRQDHFSYIVLDEFHHGAAPSYQKVVSYFKPKFMLGLTATPERMDKKDILSLLENNIVYSLTTSEAIRRGFLVPFTYYGLHDNVDYTGIRHNGFRYDLGDLERTLLIPMRDAAIVDKHRELVADRKAIGFCVSIKHAERMEDVFNSQGIASVAIHSNMSMDERSRRIRMYESGKVRCAFVRDIFNEGVDFPDTEALLFLRPTESKIVFQQQLGRGLRLSVNKKNVFILDFIGNYIGASEVPAFVKAICSGREDFDRLIKPEYIFDNGCAVKFSARAIENISIPTHRLYEKARYFSKIVERHESLKRPLTPLDVFLALGPDFGPLIASMGSYRRVVERMNSLEEDCEIIDSKISDVDSLVIDGEISDDVFQDICSRIFLNISEFVVLIKKSGATTRDRTRHLDSMRQLTRGVIELLSPLCLVQNYVKASISDGESLAAYDTDIPLWAVKFFGFVGKESRSRNSIAISNYLRDGIPFFIFLGALSGNQIKGEDLIALDMLLSREKLTWLSDFYEFVNLDNILY